MRLLRLWELHGGKQAVFTFTHGFSGNKENGISFKLYGNGKQGL